MALVNVRNLALSQFENPNLNEIYAYYRKSDEALTLVHRPDPDSRSIPSDEKLGVEYVDRIHAPIPDTLSEYLTARQQVFEKTKREIQAALDSDWQRAKEIVHAELPEGDEMLYCPHCGKRTQHTATITLPGGYPLLECVICDGGRI